jgi:hypothetical protein
MDANTGRIFPSVAAALLAGVAKGDLVTGERKALLKVRRRIRMADRCEAQHSKARRRMQKASRRANRSRR